MKIKQNSSARLIKGQFLALSMILFLLNLTFGQTLFTNNPGKSSFPKSAEQSKELFVPGELLVRFTNESAAVSKENTISSLQTDKGQIQFEVENFEGAQMLSGLRLVKVEAGQTLDAVEALNNRQDVLYAEPNYIYHNSVVPNDPNFRNLWGLQNTGQTYATSGGNPLSGTPDADIDAELAWDRTTGSKNVVVGIIDSGVDINHPDLQANIWVNPGEVAGNGVDDDNNGFIDDVNGWDFVNKDATVFDSGDDESHGTHVAGTVGAKGNNGVGITGVNWDVSLMALKSSKGGAFSTTSLLAAYNYAKLMKDRWDSSGGASGANLRVLNNSYGGSGRSQATEDAIVVLGNSGILFVAAAGNETVDNDLLPHFPSSYRLTNIIAVAASDDKDNLASFSNFGLGSVSLAAPGRAILSTTPNNNYSFFSGTSMASPQVAGAAALIIAANPTISVGKLRSALVYGSEPIAGFQSKVDSVRRLNVNDAMQVSFQNDTTPPGKVANLGIASANGRIVNLKWTAPADNGNLGRAALYQVDFSSNTGGIYRLYSGIPNAPGTAETAVVKLPYQNPSGNLIVRAIDQLGNSSTSTIAVSVDEAAVNPYQQKLEANQTLSNGTAINLKGDDTYRRNYDLPFAFPFFGTSYNKVTISTNGILYFSVPPVRSNGDGDDASSSVEALNAHKMIAGLWDDLRTDRNAGDDVYVTTETDRIIFRWKAVTFNTPTSGGSSRGENPVNFEIELNKNGVIKLRYGAGNTKLFSVVGISPGEFQAYVAKSHTYIFGQGAVNLTNAQTIVFSANAGTTPTTSTTRFDFDGDKKTDISIFRPAPGEWWYLRSSDNTNRALKFGTSTDKIVPADYTGDGKTDVAFFRPSTGQWFILRSEDQTFFAFPFGASGDIPAPGDFDGDGKADPAVFRPSNATWYILKSTGGTDIRQFGVAEDIPQVADYDGDGKADLGVFRPTPSQWWIAQSTGGTKALQFGATGDKPVAADYTGDGKTDVAFFRPSTGQWFILRSEDSSFYAFPFGAVGDQPAPGDYDGDGKADAAVFRNSNLTWYLQRSNSGFQAIGFGVNGDKPVPSAYIP